MPGKKTTTVSVMQLPPHLSAMLRHIASDSGVPIQEVIQVAIAVMFAVARNATTKKITPKRRGPGRPRKGAKK